MKDIRRHEYKGSLSYCLDCFKPITDNSHLAKDKVVILDSTGHTAALHCEPGHVCPTCKTEWCHDYLCNHTRQGLCPNCAQQNTVDINRPNHIKEIQENGKVNKHIEGEEYAILKLQHEEFIVYNITHDPITHALRTNWQSELAAYNAKIERIIEDCRINLSSSHIARTKQEQEDLIKLTPEEREQQARDAIRPKRLKKELPPSSITEVKADKAVEKSNKAIKDILVKMHLDDTLGNRNKVRSILGLPAETAVEVITTAEVIKPKPVIPDKEATTEVKDKAQAKKEWGDLLTSLLKSKTQGKGI